MLTLGTYIKLRKRNFSIIKILGVIQNEFCSASKMSMGKKLLHNQFTVLSKNDIM